MDQSHFSCSTATCGSTSDQMTPSKAQHSGSGSAPQMQGPVPGFTHLRPGLGLLGLRGALAFLSTVRKRFLTQVPAELVSRQANQRGTAPSPPTRRILLLHVTLWASLGLLAPHSCFSSRTLPYRTRQIVLSDLTDGRGPVLCPEAPLLENSNLFFKTQIKCLISLHLCLSLTPRQSCGSFYGFP